MSATGIALRETAGFVTDGASDTYYIADSGGITRDQYPTVRGGITFGDDDGHFTGLHGRDRNAGIDVRLAGMAFPSGASMHFRIDVAGPMTVNLAVGDASNAQTNQQIDVSDSVGIKFSWGPTNTGGVENFIDATGVNRTSAADWATNNAASASYTFADYIRITVYDSTFLAYVHWTAVVSGSNGTLLLLGAGT